MSFRQFVINNVRRNPKVYGPYFFTSFFAVMMFFTYALLIFHPEFKTNIDSSSDTMSYFAMVGFQISQVIIVIFSAFAIFYAVSTFLKTRKAEFGLLLIQGINKKQLVKLIFWENMLAGLSAVICGVIFGFIFSKVILLVCSKILALTETLPFYLPWKPILLTIGIFGLLFLIVSFVTSFTIRVNNLKALLLSQKEPKKEIRAAWYIALLALVLTFTGYGIVLFFTNREYFSLTPIFIGVILVVVGTYFLFSQLLVFVLTRLRKRQSFFFKRTNLLTFSELIYQMRDNVSTFFIVAVISATAITAMGTSSAIGSSGIAEMSENPYAITYTAFGQDKVHPDIISYTKKLLQQDDTRTYKQANGHLFTVVNANNNKSFTFLSVEDYNELMKLRNEKEIQIPVGSVALLPSLNFNPREGIPKSMTIQLETTKITLPVDRATPINRFLSNYENIMLANKADIDTIWKTAQKANKNPDENFNSIQAYSIFHTNDWEETAVIGKKLQTYIGDWNTKNQDTETGEYTNFESLALQWQNIQQLNGILLLLTVLCGAVFYTFSAGFIYLRLHSDLKRDEQQYKMLFKIGLTKQELHKIVARQLRIMFFLPLFVAVIHSLVAFVALQNLLDFNIWQNVGIVIGIFIVVQAIYYFFVKCQYLKQLRRIMK
ncbi:ABC transporter permease [Listeria rocourtiae]|uniref:ABC transporter permease n=1 Tax=Listeria rocourtiae TaxID=647910 RepID=UPI003D2F88E0